MLIAAPALQTARRLNRQMLSAALLSIILLGLSAGRALAECAPFYDSLNDTDSIESNAGVITGPLAFAPAVNANGALLSGTCHVTYSGDLFNAGAGSASLWFKKTSPDEAGGILQIGTLGQPNSLGLFYNGQTNLYLEARNNIGTLTQLLAPSALSQTQWTHLVAAWQVRGDGSDLWLFVNGLTAAHAYLPGVSNYAAAQLQLGITGFYGPAEGMIDEARFFDWNLLESEVYAEYVFSSNRHRHQPTGKPLSTGNVQLLGRTLLVDGRPFTVAGVGYQPIPIGAPISREVLDFIYTDPDIIARDLALLRAMNVNTIRLWSQAPDATLLDACHNGGVDPIYVIMGFWVPLSPGVDYADPATIAALEADFADYVNQFKDHPAVLAWGIGNENNLAYGGDLADWFTLANNLAGVAYAAEGAAYHPIMVINGALRQLGDMDYNSDDLSMNWVDIWGNNTYPGDDFHCYFDYYEMLSAKPLILTEFGIDAYDNQAGTEYQAVQADYVVQQWRQIERGSLGGTVMAYSDEWWKAGDPPIHDLGGYNTFMHPDGYSNEEWWGLLGVEDDGPNPDIMHPRLVYDALAAEFAFTVGDLNCDGRLDGDDIIPFALALTDPAGYEQQYPDCDILNADLDGDGNLNLADARSLVDALLAS